MIELSNTQKSIIIGTALGDGYLRIPKRMVSATLRLNHSLSRKEYLKFFRELFPLFKEQSKRDARIAFLNSDWRDFSGMAAREEDPKKSILISDYIKLLERSGWEITHIIDCPLSSQRFKPNQVRRMQNNRTLGIVRRSLIVGRNK